MTAAASASWPIAMDVRGLSKHYRLGELQSLRQTANRLLQRSNPTEDGGIEALSEVSFTVYRGDAIGLVGANGSGKSTLLQLLAGTSIPTGGELEVHGRVLPLLAVGTGFHGDLTGRENVMLFASSLGIPLEVIRGRMEAVAAFAEIERHIDTPVKRYSAGMVARLTFSVAMQFPADIYVFDEVLAVVDGEFQERCIAEIRTLHAQGRTIIFVSHDLDQVATVCERVVWLADGRLERVGPPDEVLADYSAHHRASQA